MDTLLGISWLWWALGTFGMVGTGLLLWLAPGLLVQIATWLFKFFVTTRLGNIIAAAAIAFFVADVNRSLRDEHEFAARTAAFEQAQQQRDAGIRQETRENVLREIGEQNLANSKTDQAVKDFKHELSPVPFVNGVSPFRVGADSCRLRALAGYAGCGPVGAQGVPKARSQGDGAGPKHWQRLRLPRLITGGVGGAEKGQ